MMAKVNLAPLIQTEFRNFSANSQKKPGAVRTTIKYNLIVINDCLIGRLREGSAVNRSFRGNGF